MNKKVNNVTVVWLSFPLAALVTFTSLVALFTPGFYSAETPTWQAQSIGQDLVDLLLVIPALLVSSLLAYRNVKAALYVWAGVLAYLLYTFLIYCFAIHFNKLFLFYCFTLGVSFFSLIWFFYSFVYKKPLIGSFENVPHRLIAIYFIAIAVIFYLLWLVEIIPAILRNETPASVKETGLFTNAVHVIDLSMVLPGFFVTGLLLLRKGLLGYILAPVILSFFILMDITIGTLVIIMKQSGLEGSYMLTLIVYILAIVSAMLLYWYIKRIKISQ